MKEEYYLISKETMDKVMGELGSFAYVTNSYEDLNPINESLTNCSLIDLSDEAIEDKARAFYWLRHPNKIIAENTRPDMVIGYFQALIDLKKQIL